jgi:hypothetical protein
LSLCLQILAGHRDTVNPKNLKGGNVKKAWTLLFLIALAGLAWPAAPISFEVVVTDSSFSVDSLGGCLAFDTTFPAHIILDSVQVYEVRNDSVFQLQTFTLVSVNSVIPVFWQSPGQGEHMVCVAGFWEKVKGCENCTVLTGKLLPPKIRIGL